MGKGASAQLHHVNVQGDPLSTSTCIQVSGVFKTASVDLKHLKNLLTNRTFQNHFQPLILFFSQVDGVCKVAPVVALLAGDPSASARFLKVMQRLKPISGVFWER